MKVTTAEEAGNRFGRSAGHPSDCASSIPTATSRPTASPSPATPTRRLSRRRPGRVSLCERVSESEPFKSADHRCSNATRSPEQPGDEARVGATLAVAHPATLSRPEGARSPIPNPARLRFLRTRWRPTPLRQPGSTSGPGESPLGDPVVDRALGHPQHLFQIRDPVDAGLDATAGRRGGEVVLGHARIPSSGNWQVHIHGFHGLQ